MRESWQEKIELAGLKFGNVHSQVYLDHSALILAGLAEQTQDVRQIVTLLVLDQIGLGDAGDSFGSLNGIREISKLINKAEPVSFGPREYAAIRVRSPVGA